MKFRSSLLVSALFLAGTLNLSAQQQRQRPPQIDPAKLSAEVVAAHDEDKSGGLSSTELVAGMATLREKMMAAVRGGRGQGGQGRARPQGAPQGCPR